MCTVQCERWIPRTIGRWLLRDAVTSGRALTPDTPRDQLHAIIDGNGNHHPISPAATRVELTFWGPVSIRITPLRITAPRITPSPNAH